MPVDENVERGIRDVFACIKSQHAPHYMVFIQDKEGLVEISTRYDMLLDTYKSDVEHKTVGFPRSALEELVKNALASGSAQANVTGRVDRVEEVADDWCGEHGFIDRYSGPADIKLSLSIKEGETEFSYSAEHADK